MTRWPLPEPMALALAEARKAGEAGEVPIGAVLVARGRVIAAAHNETRGTAYGPGPSTPDPTAHAEILAIRRGAAVLGAERLGDCELWVTLEPCAMCAGAIAHARIARLVYAAPDPKGGGVDHGARVFAHPQCLHRPEVLAGIGEAEAATLLRGFFRARRM